MRLRAENGYFLSILGLLLAAVLAGWLMTLAMKTYFKPRPVAGNAAGPVSPETPGDYESVVDRTREATRLLSDQAQERVRAFEEAR